jgi:hypothetical protein
VALLDDMYGELAVQRAIHGRHAVCYEFVVSTDVLEQLGMDMRARHPEIDDGGVPLTRAWDVPVIVDKTLPENTIRVDWSYW